MKKITRSNKLKKNKFALIVILLSITIIVLLITLLTLTHNSQAPVNATALKSNPQKVKEIADELSKKSLSFEELRDELETISDTHGATFSFDVLRIVLLPPSIDLHLLGHIIGDKLYEQVGVEGMKICTDEFRNACSHSIVVNYLYEHGEGSLPDIVKACSLAPGGKGAYAMCFHGLGHGVLSFTEYDLKKTVEMCKKTGPTNYSSREYIECVGGAIMEIISGGGHDRALWSQKRVDYLKPDSPLEPCSTEVIPEDAKPQCYTYLTPYLFEAAGADLSNPTPQDFVKSFKFCDEIPVIEKQNRDQCFGGFGKEFIVLARNRDIRNIESMPIAQLQKIVDWCQLAKEDDGIWSCIDNALRSLYWGGENKPIASTNFCSLVPERFKNNCFTSLYSAVKFYEHKKENIISLCNQVPAEQKQNCRTNFSL